MDLLELALNPRKANQRFSPFTNEMPPGAARKLEYYFGENASVDPAERAIYSRDASTPPATINMLLKRDAWAVVRPQVRGDLFRLIEIANDNFIPIVPRGAGTSGYGGSVPTEGGIVVDLRAFNHVIAIDKANQTVTVEGNITFWALEEALRKEGLALRQYPTSAYAATVAGWIAQGGGGVGSLKYGPFKNDVVQCKLITPKGEVRVFKGDDLDLVNEVFGITGFIVEVELKVRVATVEAPYLASFPDADAAMHAARRLGVESKAWSLHVNTPEYAELVNEAAKEKLLPANKWSALVVLESNENAAQIELVKGIVTAAGGTLHKDVDAKKAWDARFNHLNLKRLGPSVVVSEATIPITKFKEGMQAAREVAQMERQCFWAIAVSPTEFDIIYYGLEDERRPVYPTALGNSLAIIDAVKAQGGKAYATGVLGSNESEALLNDEREPLKAQFAEPARHATAFIGGLVGGVTLWLLMSLVAIFAGDYLANLHVTLAGAMQLWATVTGASGSATIGLALVKAVVIGAIVGLVLAGPVALVAFRRGDPFLNLLIGVLYGSTAYILFTLVTLWFDIPTGWTQGPAVGIAVILVAGALGGIYGLPLGIAGAILLRKHKGRLRRLQEFRAKTDPREVFNPGPVLGARTRPMPLPAKDFPVQLALAAPILKSQRGAFPFRGGEKADPSLVGLNRAIGRIHAGPLADVDYAVNTCIFCGFCNAVAPEAGSAKLESQLPRGRVQVAKAVLDGKAELTAEMTRNLARAPLSHTPDAICPTLIPIARVTDLVLAAGVAKHGPVTELAPLAANAEKEGNVFGKPNANRSKWAALAWDTEAHTLFYGDDEGSFNAPETLSAAARAIMNANVRLNYLGPAEKTSGAPLFETGQRKAAVGPVGEMIETCAKRGIDVIVSPDANTVRAVRLDWPLLATEEDLAPPPNALHTTEALAQYVKAKRLEFETPYTKKIIYHCPEALEGAARAAGGDVLKAMGATVLAHGPMECGHGRGLHLSHPQLQQQIAEKAIKDAVTEGAEAIVCASPGCYALLKSVAKKAKAAVEVVDLHELVATHMKISEGASAAAVAAPVAAEPEEMVEPEIPADHFRVEFVKEKKVVAVHKNANLLDAALEAGMELPYSCRAGSCDTCSAKWEGTPPDQSAGAALSPDQQKTYVLTCIARPKGPVKIWSDERP